MTGTGISTEAAHRHHADLPEPAAGQHQWIVMTVYRVADPTAPQQNLDMENLLTIEGPGCLVCEKAYSPELAAGPCAGDPGV